MPDWRSASYPINTATELAALPDAVTAAVVRPVIAELKERDAQLGKDITAVSEMIYGATPDGSPYGMSAELTALMGQAADDDTSDIWADLAKRRQRNAIRLLRSANQELRLQLGRLRTGRRVKPRGPLPQHGDCRMWLAVAYANDLPYGYALLYQASGAPQDGLQMAEINAFWLPALASLIQERNAGSHPPEFFDMLLKEAESVARNNASDQFVITPTRNEEKLMSHRTSAFVRVPRVDPVCSAVPLAVGAEWSYIGLVPPELETRMDFWDNYELGEKLGEGKYGHVFLATDRSTGQQYALKLTAANPDSLEELDLLRAVTTGCPGVIQYLGAAYVPFPPGFDDLPLQLGVLMEYVQGRSLKQMGTLTSAERSVPQLRNFIEQFLEQLRCLHEHGLYHRDLHWDNILVDRATGQLRIIDFGLTCVSDWRQLRHSTGALCAAAKVPDKAKREPVIQMLVSKDLVQGVGEILAWFYGTVDLKRIPEAELARLERADPRLYATLMGISSGDIASATEALRQLGAPL